MGSLGFLGIPWVSLGFLGIPWGSFTFCRIPQGPSWGLGFLRVLGVPWCSLGFLRVPYIGFSGRVGLNGYSVLFLKIQYACNLVTLSKFQKFKRLPPDIPLFSIIA